MTLSEFSLFARSELRTVVEVLADGGNKSRLETLADVLEGIRVELVTRAHRG